MNQYEADEYQKRFEGVRRISALWIESMQAAVAESEMDTAKRMRGEGATTNTIAKAVGVSRPTISRLLSGKTWGQP